MLNELLGNEQERGMNWMDTEEPAAAVRLAMMAHNAAPQPTAGNEATGDEADERSHER